VLGAEADWQWTSLKSTIDAAYPAFANPGNPAFTNNAHTEHVSSRLQSFATVRGRIGYTFDRLLVYATGGLAIGHIKSETNVTFATGAPAPVYNGAVHIGSDSTTRFGWVLGGGGEYSLAGNWSIKAEYLYVNLGTYTYASPLVAATAAFVPGYSWTTTVREHEHIARIGLNYKFR
jgi:outer membrane immunogenic protein